MRGTMKAACVCTVYGKGMVMQIELDAEQKYSAPPTEQ